MDRGAYSAIVHSVAKSQTWLSWVTEQACTHRSLDKKGVAPGLDAEDCASLGSPTWKPGAGTGRVWGFGLSPVDCLCEGLSINRYLMTRIGVHGRDQIQSFTFLLDVQRHGISVVFYGWGNRVPGFNPVDCGRHVCHSRSALTVLPGAPLPLFSLICQLGSEDQQEMRQGLVAPGGRNLDLASCVRQKCYPACAGPWHKWEISLCCVKSLRFSGCFL